MLWGLPCSSRADGFFIYEKESYLSTISSKRCNNCALLAKHIPIIASLLLLLIVLKVDQLL